ncbi:hypothetical protein BH09ACT4_BH09ACT4_13260 [soil metagenome]
MSLGAETDAVPPAGWYPDPVDSSRSRWWSGAAWTEHVEEPAPDLNRFSRDPSMRPVLAEVVSTAPQRDPYRDRNVLAGLALVVALLSVPGTIADVFLKLPDMISYFVGGVPMSLAILGLIASIKLGFPTRMAWLALAISTVTMVVGLALNAQEVTSDLNIPGIEVPGLSQITELENESGVGG